MAEFLASPLHQTATIVRMLGCDVQVRGVNELLSTRVIVVQWNPFHKDAYPFRLTAA